MSEEEKKIIQRVEEKIDFVKYNYLDEDILGISIKNGKTLLTIIEKQQKEIEELKKDKKALVDNYSKVLETFISKDKIKEKIKELADRKFLLIDEQDYCDRSVLDDQIDILEELLEE